MDNRYIAFVLVGVVLIVLGFVTWKKRTTAFLHSYHYREVKEEDLPEYTRLMGIGQIIIGVGFIVTGALKYFTAGAVTWVGLIVGLLIGLVFIFKAQAIAHGLK